MYSHSTSHKRGQKTSLVLTGTARLALQRGRLFVEEGFGNLGTRRTLEFDPPLSLQSVILLTNGGTFSDHALRMLAENGVSLYSLKQTGEIEYFICPAEGTIKPGLLRLQASLPDIELGLVLSKLLIRKKIEGQEKTLAWLSKKAVLPGMEVYASSKALLSQAVEKASDFNALRLVEARAADEYFSSWIGMPISFHKVAKGCVEVPLHWKRWEGRNSLRSGDKQDATNPLNALLNFSYAVTAAETMIACRAASLNPSLGLLHTDKDGRPSFIYDLMEPLRPITDRLLLELLTKRTFTMNKDFLLLKEGVCRIGIEFAAEIGKLISESLRPEAEKIVNDIQKALLSVATTTYRVPREYVAKKEQNEPTEEESREVTASASLLKSSRPKASPTGICCKCGVKVGKRSRYCDTCRTERFSQIWKQQWEKRKETGIDTSHGGDAAKKRGEAIARSNPLKPRKLFSISQTSDE